MIKKVRDTQRMTTFITKKNCQELPFYDLNNSELMECFPKHHHLHSQYKSVINFIIEECESETSLRDAVCDNLEEQVKQLKQKSQSDQELLHSKSEIVASISVEKSKQETENQQLRQQVQHLKSKLEHSKYDLDNKDKLRKQLHQVTEERNHLIKHYRNISAAHSNLKETYKKVSQELANFVDIHYTETEQSPNNCRRKFQCRRCGSAIYHTKKNCLANENSCAICRKQNHLTAVCRDRIEVVIDDQSVQEILHKL